ncbi:MULTISPECIES: anti-sigma factor family protein [unclassified Sphingomonas]|uniref:anti-sigma factor family protein n=1 Tax=unclassified Sphingomonas TaxID=196159 RepID=UPI002150FB4C|nr:MULTISPECIES: anti-sigma factor [unclassified Sphingomonas]MCR5870630.1 anti-sigma factor [Sphingomonas sp. J344]UUY01027.1 anti-sigma factor [Sphingomonas sp. J315]
MTIDPEMLMAYADGELDPLAAKRVERAIAADPALAQQVEAHRALITSLRTAFAPVADAPPPHSVVAMLAESARVVPLARPSTARRERPIWMGAVAASLVAGLFGGALLMPRGGEAGIAFEQGQAIARGDLARALDTQLASSQASDGPVRIGVSFRDKGGTLCRSFERAGSGGIACAADKNWRIERLYGGSAQAQTDYRQAGSASAAIMRDAQEMMAGEPLDAEAERAALAGR